MDDLCYNKDQHIIVIVYLNPSQIQYIMQINWPSLLCHLELIFILKEGLGQTDLVVIVKVRFLL